MLNLNRKKYQALPDEVLLGKYKEKQSSMIFGEIYRRYGHLVFGTAMKYLKNKHDAEDTTMIVFEKIREKLVEHNIQHLSSWIYMVTKNECLMVLRKNNHTTVELTTEIKSESPSDQELYIQKDIQYELLEKAIDELKEEQQNCIRLFYLDQKSYQEITNLLDLDIKKVKSAIQNGKRNLRINLERNNEFK